MLLKTKQTKRSGAIIPMVAISLVALFAFLALAIDIGMLLVSMTQAQNAADAAALAGARTLNGKLSDPGGFNSANALLNAQDVANLNVVLGQGVQPADNLVIQFGTYNYDSTQQAFIPNISDPGQVPPNPTVVQVTYNPKRGVAFARVIGVDLLTVYVTAVAAHRPRDTCIVLDFSGSMNDQSDLWNAVAYLGSDDNTSNNADPVFPLFGHYSDKNSAMLQNTSTNKQVGLSNVAISPPNLQSVVSGNIVGVPALVNDFGQNKRNQAAQVAFNPAPNSQATQPAGDQYLFTQGTNNFAHTVQEINGTSNTQWAGYTKPPFQGFTQGPGYWGNTFFIWPPDPNQANDWRQKFFLKPGGKFPNFGGPVDDNTILWNPQTGQWNVPASYDPKTKQTTVNYVINYSAILAWIQKNCMQSQSAPNNPFPPRLRAGDVTYYDTTTGSGFPTDVPASAYDHTQENSSIADPNQRFWKEYIDFTLGVWRAPRISSASTPGSVSTPGKASMSYGPDFTWGNVHLTTKPQGPQGMAGTGKVVGSYSEGSNKPVQVAGFSAPPQVGQLVQFTDTTTPLYTITAVNGNNTITLDRALTSAVADQASATLSNPYMNYLDNPPRPRHQFWFGPMTMIQYLLDTGHMPGTSNEIQSASAKHGIDAALLDIQNNHPNDLVSLILFNRPYFNANGLAGNADPPGIGNFNEPQIQLTNDYTSLRNALYFPPVNPKHPNKDVSVFDQFGLQTPCAGADYAFDTCTNYGLMLAYNQFSGASHGGVGGLGRNGALRVVILETDGMANEAAGAQFTANPAGVSGGVNKSFYNVGVQPTDQVSKDKPTPLNSALTYKPITGIYGPDGGQGAANVAAVLCGDTTGKPIQNNPLLVGPGYAVPGKPVALHCIAFGSIFETTASGGEQADAMKLLSLLAAIGQTPFPSTVTDTDPTHDPWKIVTGDAATRQAKMTTAFTNIMDSDVPVSLIK
jgi:hypothetical protein